MWGRERENRRKNESETERERERERGGVEMWSNGGNSQNSSGETIFSLKHIPLDLAIFIRHCSRFLDRWLCFVVISRVNKYLRKSYNHLEMRIEISRLKKLIKAHFAMVYYKLYVLYTTHSAQYTHTYCARVHYISEWIVYNRIYATTLPD